MIQDNHVYYNKTVAISHPLSVYYANEFDRIFSLYRASRNRRLNNGRNIALPVDLSFPFDFYGHPVHSVVVTTGGFLYLNEITHPYLPFSQYIAPLMAEFLTQSSVSDIKFVLAEGGFWVRWENMMLASNTSLGKFSFQCAFFRNGSIVFDYISIPISMAALRAASPHLLKVGLSDAFYYDVKVPELGTVMRKIVKYHELEIPLDRVSTECVIQLAHLPTCNQQTTCQQCTNRTRAPTFNCSWCYELERCSSGVDRQLQQWLDSECHYSSVGNSCSASAKVQKLQQSASAGGHVILGACLGGLAVAAVCALIGAVAYGYRHPGSRIGTWLIEHRPSRLGRASSAGQSYKIGGDSPYMNFSNA